MRITRRDLLALAGAGAFSRLGQPLKAAETDPPMFEEIPPSASGLTWVHDNAMSDKRHLPETMGPGCAFFDYDNDGWMDILLVNSGTSFFYKPKQTPSHALYKNNRDGTFTDVTAKAGITADIFGMGCAVGDYDNDGNADILLTAYPGVVLYKNNGDGTFTDVTAKSGLNSFTRWSTSAVWFDYDNDGLLDLFICSFVEYGPNSITCGDNKLGRAYYCIPRVFKPTASALYHNNGDGTFTDVSKNTDISRAMGKALGVVASDVNNDGLMDLFVANDTVQNFLFLNRGKGNWAEVALSAGVGFSENGSARSGMGVDAADVNGDGWDDLFVANVDHQMFSVYRNEKDETFTDISHQNTVAQATRLLSGWGLKYFDWNNDGTIDLFLANGHPDDMIENYSQQVRYKEPLLIFRQEEGTFKNVSAQGGPIFSKAFAARGLAIGDYNNDGSVDVLIGNNGGAPTLIKNNAAIGAHWIGITLVGAKCNRDAVGARVRWSVQGKVRQRQKSVGGSYLSSHDPRLVLGVGAATAVDWVEVRWPAPSGRTERFSGLEIDRYHTLTEGKGSPAKS